jgi:hypothetical protein
VALLLEQFLHVALQRLERLGGAAVGLDPEGVGALEFQESGHLLQSFGDLRVDGARRHGAASWIAKPVRLPHS